jgi:hypothetical protein
MGHSPLRNNTTGSNNSAFGQEALFYNTTASNNTAVGYQAGYSNVTGTRCAFFGAEAGKNTTTSDNTFIGNNAGSAITTGDANTILGRFSGNEGGLDIRTASNYIVLSDGDGNPRGFFDSTGQMFVATSTFASGQNGVLMRGTSGSYTDEVLQTRTAGTASTSATGFYNNNGRVGTISTSGTATAYNTSSDYRLKNSIAPMTSALDKVTQLKPCTYKWNADGSEGQGFIAHELAEIVPQCVHGEKDAVDSDGNPVYQGIDTSFLVATLTAAIQEQQAIIESLKARLDAANL